MATVPEYPILIFWSEEDGGYIADLPDLEHCSAFGRTAAEALAELEVAKTAWLETAREHGDPLPEPTSRPVVVPAAS
jgi:predicted RNase H-like HicB family nuclease